MLQSSLLEYLCYLRSRNSFKALLSLCYVSRVWFRSATLSLYDQAGFTMHVYNAETFSILSACLEHGRPTVPWQVQVEGLASWSIRPCRCMLTGTRIEPWTFLRSGATDWNANRHEYSRDDATSVVDELQLVGK